MVAETAVVSELDQKKVTFDATLSRGIATVPGVVVSVCRPTTSGSLRSSQAKLVLAHCPALAYVHAHLGHS